MNSNAAIAALAAPVHERGSALIQVSEDQWFDRKSVEIQPAKLAEAICAFANADGGTIVVGLSDGVVQGVDGQVGRVNSLRQASIDFLRPTVPVKIDLVPCTNSRGTPDHVLVMTTQPSETVHETANGQCFLRVGDETRKLSFAHRQELEFDRGRAKYEAQRLPGRSMGDLDANLVAAYKKAAGATAPTQQFLASRGLLTPHLGRV